MDELIKIDNVTFRYDVIEDDNTQKKQNKIILNNVSLKVKSGEFVAVLGANGCGKSTIAKHMNAILIPENGTVIIDGIDTTKEEMLFTIRQTVGMVFQNPDNQIVATLVEDDVAFGLENIGVPQKEMRVRVDNALADVGMTEFSLHSPSQLSGGQKQRVAIAGILALAPKCIVLDEPTAMLDPKGRREVMKTILRLQKEYKTTVILITHFMDEAVQADRVVVMDEGNVVLEGTPREVFSNVEKIKSLGLDVPQVTQLIFELQKEGLDLPNGVLDVEEAVLVLSRLLEE